MAGAKAGIVRLVVVDGDRAANNAAGPSTLIYLWRLWGATGIALLFLFAVACLAVWSSLFPAHAEEARVVRPAGKGFYDASSLTGDAAREVRAYLDRTWVECDDGAGHGRCNLNASTDSVHLRYVDEIAVALIFYENDTGNMSMTRLALWRHRPDGRYDLLADQDAAPDIEDMAATRKDASILRPSGLVRRPGDTRCCPTRRASFDLAYGAGWLKVAEAPASKVGEAASASRPRAIRNIVDAGLAEPIFMKGDSFVHNGSYVNVDAEHGVIAYYQPKAALKNLVRAGDVIFRGRFGRDGIVGTAYLFKAGCEPLGYPVRGRPYRSGGDDFVLEGAAPVRGWGCDVIGLARGGSNARLRFEPAGGYNEPDFVENDPPPPMTPEQVVAEVVRLDVAHVPMLEPVPGRITKAHFLTALIKQVAAAFRIDEPVMDGDPITGQQQMSALKLGSTKQTMSMPGYAEVTASVSRKVDGDPRWYGQKIAFRLMLEDNRWVVDDICSMPTEAGAWLKPYLVAENRKHHIAVD